MELLELKITIVAPHKGRDTDVYPETNVHTHTFQIQCAAQEKELLSTTHHTKLEIKRPHPPVHRSLRIYIFPDTA